jgi:tetratricopeptide (TPR) repeat protein
MREKGSAAALPHGLRAIELDPKFALAYWAVGGNYTDVAEYGRAREYYAKAFEFRERASEREKLLIAGYYYMYVSGELEKARQIYEEWVESYPQDYIAWGSLGVAESELGEYEKALEANREFVRLSPDNVIGYVNLSAAWLAVQRLDEARRTLMEAQQRNLDELEIHNNLYGVDFLGGDAKGMAQELQWMESRPEYSSQGFSFASDTAAFAGQMRAARRLTVQGVEAAVRSAHKENAGIWEANSAIREAGVGEIAEARGAAEGGLKLAPESPGVQVEATLAWAMSGETQRTEGMAKQLAAKYPQDTQMQSLWLPTIAAEVELNRKNPQKALNLLEQAKPLEMAMIGFSANASCLYAPYVRGQAYLAMGAGAEAAGEFQKILDHGGLVWNCWTGALAHLGMGRAAALESKRLQGVEAERERERAKTAYKDFLSLWKDGDTDVPLLTQARAEYAKLE